MVKKKVVKTLLIIGGIITLVVALIIPIQWKLANYYTKKGNENLEKHFYKTAFSNYEKASALMPNDENLKIQLGKLYFLKNNLEEAEKEFKKAKSINNNAEANSLLIKTLLLEKKIGEAEKIATKLRGKILENKELQIQQARVYADIEEVDNALNILSDNTESEASYYKAVFYIANKDFAKSENIIKELDLDQDSLKNNLSKIISSFERIKSSENETYKTVVLAQTLNEIDEPYLAEILLKETVENNPNYRDASVFLGYTNLLKKDFEESRNYLLKSIEIDPVYGLSYYFLGKLDLEENNTNAAITNLQKAVDFNYKTKLSFESLGKLTKQTEDYEKAAENFKKALELDPNNNDILFELIETLILEKKIDEAESIVLKNESNKLLGFVYLEKEDYEKALGYLKKALQEEPFSAFVSLKMGQLYNKQNKNSEAQEHFLKVIEFDLTNRWTPIAKEKLD